MNPVTTGASSKAVILNTEILYYSPLCCGDSQTIKLFLLLLLNHNIGLGVEPRALCLPDKHSATI